MALIKSQRVFEFFQLEERILLSADGLDDDPSQTDSELHPDFELLNSYLEQMSDPTLMSGVGGPVEFDEEAKSIDFADSPSWDPARRLEVIFIDQGIDDSNVLLEGIRDHGSDGTQWLVVHLSSDEDGIEQITNTLEALSGVDAVHIVSHGDGEGIQLGNARLHRDSVDQYASRFVAWAQSFDEEADVLVYGCDLASTIEGRELIEAISTLCDCDVAASDDATGHEILGGDWDLEFTIGMVETKVAFSMDAQETWNGLLADTGWKSPSATGDDHAQWSNPANAYSSDNADAKEDRNGQRQDWYNFNFGVPGGASIDGIEIQIEGNNQWELNGVAAELSWDGGATYTASGIQQIWPNSGSDSIQTLGSAAELWGRAWSSTDFSDTHFRIRLTKIGSEDYYNFDVDHLQVKVHYSGGNSAPTITSNGSGSTAAVNVAENTAAVTTVLASDSDLPAQTLTYSIMGGSDFSLFSINSSGGQLSFTVAPNYELPSDANGDGVYEVIVAVDDGNTGTDTQAISVTVTDSIDGTTLYLKSDTTPPFSNLSTVSPTETNLPNYDPLRDSIAGLIISKGGFNANETDDVKHHTFVLSGPVNIANQEVELVFWSDIKDGMNSGQTADVTLGKNATVTAYLIDLATATTESGGMVIASGTVADSTWGDGYVWEQKIIDFGTVNHSVASGRHLAVKLIVNSSSADDVWFAYDTQGFAGRLIIGSENIAPAISLPGSSVSFLEGNGATVIDGSATVSDPNLSDFTGGVLTVDFSVAGDGDDRLAIRNQGTGVGQIGVSSNVVTYNFGAGAVAIGTLSGGTNGSTPLLVSFNADSDNVSVEATLRNVTYNNVSEDPSMASRNVRFVLTDGDGGTSNTEIAIVDITPVNDAPTTSTVVLAAIAEDSGARTITQAELLANASDLEGDLLTATGLAISTGSGTLVNNGDGTWDYTPAGDDDTSVSFSYSITDGSDNVAGSATLDITPVNDAPTLQANFGMLVSEDAIGTVVSSAMLNAGDIDDSGSGVVYTITDATDNGVLTLAGFGILGLADTFTQAALDNGDLTYSHDSSETTTDAFSFLLADGGEDGAGTVADTFLITITPINNNSISLISDLDLSSNLVVENASLGTTVGVTAYAEDADPSDSVTYSLDNNGNGAFTIDGATGVVSVSGTVDFETSPSNSITVRATSSDGSTTTMMVSITIVDINEAPIATGENFTVNPGQTLSVSGNGVIFNDSDIDGDSISVILVAAPSNGTFQLQAGGAFTYTPNVNFYGQDSFFYRVTDGSLESIVVQATIFVPLAGPANAPVSAAQNLSDSARDLELNQATFEGTEIDVEGEFALDLLQEQDGSIQSGPYSVTSQTEAGGQVSRAMDNGGSGPNPTNRSSDDLERVEAARQIITYYASVSNTLLEGGSFSPELAQLEQLLQRDLEQAIIWSMWDDSQQQEVTLSIFHVGTAGAGISVFSIGYVFWALRGGALMSVFASSLPAWRFIDPIAMLSAYRSSTTKLDEGLDLMVSRQAEWKSPEHTRDAQSRWDG